jgi:ribulose-phosphate 3-epimerase
MRHEVEHVLAETDLVCLMSVNPGFGGQKFIESTYEKVRRLKAMIHAQGTNTLIEIDGGVSDANAALLKEAGADVLVAGSYVFGSADPEETIAGLKAI